MRTCRSGVDLSTQFWGRCDPARPAEGVHHVLGVGAHHVHLLDFGLAVGFDAQFDRHPEQVQVLLNLADGAEALVVAQPVDGVFVRELRRAGAVYPLRKKRGQLLLALGFGHLLKVLGAHRLVGVLAQGSLQRLKEGLLANLPAQHVEDHGPLFEGHRLELGRKRAQPAHARQGNRVIGQGSGRDILERGPHGVLAALLLHVHQLAVAGHAVCNPGIVQGARTHLGTPPLVGHGVGQQSHAALVADPGTENSCQLRRPNCGQGIIGQFHNVQPGDSSAPKLSVKNSYCFAAVCATSLPAC